MNQNDNNAVAVSVVLGSYNRRAFIKLTIKSIREELKTLNVAHEIIVIDGGSDDGTIKWLTSQKDIITIVQHNRGNWLGKPIKRQSWGYFMNLGFKAAKGKYICMLSDDCLVVPGAISNAYKLFEEKLSLQLKIGGLAFYFRDWPDEKKFKVNKTLNNSLMINHGLFLKDALGNVNYINENDYLFYHADDDLALKLKKQGYEILEAPDSYIEHFLQANIKLRERVYEGERKDYNTLIEKWKGILKSEDANGFSYSSLYKDYSYTHPDLIKFFKLYEIDLKRKREKIFIDNSKRKLKKLVSESYYILKYFFDLCALLFTNPKHFLEKVKKTYKKYFVN